MKVQPINNIQNTKLAFGSGAKNIITKKQELDPTKWGMINLAKWGMSLPKIAQQLNTTQSRVRQCLAKNNVTTVGQKVLKEVTRKELSDLIDQNLSTNEIAKTLGIDRLTTDRLLKKYHMRTISSMIDYAVWEYSAFPSEEKKVKALKTVDPYIKRIAQKEHEKNKACYPEDYAQNLRIKFLEILEDCKNEDQSPRYITNLLDKQEPVEEDCQLSIRHPSCPPSDIKFDKYNELIKLTNMDKFASIDPAMQAVENDQHNKQLLESLMRTLKPEEKEIIQNVYELKEGLPIIPEGEDLFSVIAKQLNYKKKSALYHFYKAKIKMNCRLHDKPILKEYVKDVMKDIQTK